MISDADRCLILLAIEQSEWADEISTEAYVTLQQGQPWAPYRTLQQWAEARSRGS